MKIEVIRVKKPSPEILNFVSRLHHKYLSLSDHTYDPYWIETTIKFYDCFLFKYNGKKVGFMSLCCDGIDSVEIESLAIYKRYQRKGLGTLAINKAIDIAKKNDCSILMAGSYCIFKARGFYEKMGFELVDEGDDGVGNFWDFEKKIA